MNLKHIGMHLSEVIPLLILGVIIILIFKTYQLESSVLYMVLLFVPAIIYVIVSGKLSEFRTPGFEVKFFDIAKRSVESTLDTVESLEMNPAIVKKESKKALERQMKDLDISKPIILTLKLEKEGYDREVLLTYTKELLKYPSFKFVVFLDKENKVVAYTLPLVIFQILEQEVLGKEFVSLINKDKIQKWTSCLRIRTNTISTKSTNIDALESMYEQNLDSFIVVDENKKLKGIINRGQIHSKLLLGMK